jgi:hypothetical protein
LPATKIKLIYIEACPPEYESFEDYQFISSTAETNHMNTNTSPSHGIDDCWISILVYVYQPNSQSGLSKNDNEILDQLVRVDVRVNPAAPHSLRKLQLVKVSFQFSIC